MIVNSGNNLRKGGGGRESRECSVERRQKWFTQIGWIQGVGSEEEKGLTLRVHNLPIFSETMSSEYLGYWGRI